MPSYPAIAEAQCMWDRRFLKLAAEVASWSLDPSTKTGAVITTPRNDLVSVGWNRFGRGVENTHERWNNRELKYKLVVHCERAAAARARCPLDGYTLYTWPFPSCAPCAALMIEHGIARVICPPVPAHLRERWGADCDLAIQQYQEAGCQVLLYDDHEALPRIP
jgi:dCMP deaminase